MLAWSKRSRGFGSSCRARGHEWCVTPRRNEHLRLLYNSLFRVYGGRSGVLLFLLVRVPQRVARSPDPCGSRRCTEDSWRVGPGSESRLSRRVALRNRTPSYGNNTSRTVHSSRCLARPKRGTSPAR